MLSIQNIADIFLVEDLEEIYESDRKILECVDENLEFYLSEIDDHFLSEEKNNMYFNIGFLYSANCESDHDVKKFNHLVKQIKDEELISKINYDNFLSGFDKHQNEFYKAPSELDNDADKAAFYVERALITKYCTDNINSLKA